MFSTISDLLSHSIFLKDENLISFIRGALKIRMCYQTYNYCQKISDRMKPTEKNMHFIGGVLLGCGFFNVVSFGKSPAFFPKAQQKAFEPDVVWVEGTVAAIGPVAVRVEDTEGAIAPVAV